MLDRAVGVREAALGKEVFKGAITGTTGKKLAEDLRTNVKETRGKVMIMAGKEPPSRKVAEAHINEQIVNTTRNGEAKDAIKGLYEFIDTGKINAPAQKAMLRVMMADPGYRDLLLSVNSSIVTEFPKIMADPNPSTNAAFKAVEQAINEYLQDPTYSQKLREQLADSLNLARPVNGELAKAQAVRDHIKEQIDALDKDLDVTKTGSVAERLKKAKDDVEKFKIEYDAAGKVIPASMGAWAKRVSDINIQINTLEPQFNSDAAELAAYQVRISKGKLNPSDPDWPDYLDIRDDKEDKEKQLAALKAEKKGLDDLKVMREAEANTLQKEVDAKNADKVKRAQELKIAEDAVTTADNAAAGSDTAYIAQLEGAYDKAAKAMLPDLVNQADAQYDAVIAAEQVNEKDEDMKALNELLIGDMFFSDKEVRVGVFKKETQRGLDKGKINESYGLLVDYGPDGLISEMMESTIRASVLNKYGLTGKTLTPEETNQVNGETATRLKTLVTERGSDVALRTLSLQIRMNGTISLSDAQRIQQSDWGPGMITAALEKVDTDVEEIKALKERGAINELSRMSPNDFMSIFALLMFLLGHGNKNTVNPEGY